MTLRPGGLTPAGRLVPGRYGLLILRSVCGGLLAPPGVAFLLPGLPSLLDTLFRPQIPPAPPGCAPLPAWVSDLVGGLMEREDLRNLCLDDRYEVVVRPVPGAFLERDPEID